MGRYIVEGLLGPGGATETYLARLPDEAGQATGQLFALKLLRQDRVAEAALPEVARRFVTAGQRLRDFQRPGFGKVVDVCGDSENIFIVSEYVTGHDLARLLELSRVEAQGRSGVDADLVGLLGAEIARLLHVGHAAKPGLHHLGLAPQNVVVTDPGEVVLLDPGIAASLRAQTEQPVERWWFVAPELVRADAATLGEREGVAADLYSLGALLYFLLAGRPPPRAARPGGAVEPLRELPEASAKLNTTVRSLLSPQPADRPDSAAGLVDRLSGGVDGVRQRQRLIADGLRKAEQEAREAVARGRGTPVPTAIKLPLPADSMVADAIARAIPGLGRRRDRWRIWTASGFAAAGATAALVSLVLSAGLRPGPAFEPRGGPAVADLQPGVAKTGGGWSRSDPEAPSRDKVQSLLAGHLVAETVPPGATVWVDGAIKGTTFADIEVGPGSHRVVLTLPGHRMFRDEVDTGGGAIIRRKLVPVRPPARGTGFVRVECQTVGKFPILIDDEESGSLCPSLKLPVAIGKHTVGIFVPTVRRVVSVEITVEPGARPALAKFSE